MFDFYKYHLWILVRYLDISWWVFMCVCEFDQYLQMNWRNLVLKNRKSAGYSCMLNDNDFEVGTSLFNDLKKKEDFNKQQLVRSCLLCWHCWIIRQERTLSRGIIKCCVLCRWCTDGDSKTEGVYNSHGIK